jgi:excisionase family DNA binding protein
MSHSSAERVAHTVKGVIDCYGIQRTTVFKLIKDGKLEARKAGGRTLITTASLERWFAALPKSGESAT